MKEIYTVFLCGEVQKYTIDIDLCTTPREALVKAIIMMGNRSGIRLTKDGVNSNIIKLTKNKLEEAWRQGYILCQVVGKKSNKTNNYGYSGKIDNF